MIASTSRLSRSRRARRPARSAPRRGSTPASRAAVRPSAWSARDIPGIAREHRPDGLLEELDRRGRAAGPPAWRRPPRPGPPEKAPASTRKATQPAPARFAPLGPIPRSPGPHQGSSPDPKLIQQSLDPTRARSEVRGLETLNDEDERPSARYERLRAGRLGRTPQVIADVTQRAGDRAKWGRPMADRASSLRTRRRSSTAPGASRVELAGEERAGDGRGASRQAACPATKARCGSAASRSERAGRFHQKTSSTFRGDPTLQCGAAVVVRRRDVVVDHAGGV